MPSTRRFGAMLAVGLAATMAGAEAPPAKPLPSDMEETLEVRLVTVDVVALGADEATVADLSKDEFDLVVDGKPAEIDTLDVFCDGGSEADPTTKRIGQWPTPKDLGEGTRRVVLAFDYLHLPTAICPDSLGGGPCLYHTKALQDYQRVVAAKEEIGDEDMMVVALTGGLRVEQPFTRDREAVVSTLRRMEHDVSLWNGTFAHLTEEPLFASLRALVNVLGIYPGPKAVVFVSAGGGPGVTYDGDFDRLAAAASDARVSFYTVDCMGMYSGRAVT